MTHISINDEDKRAALKLELRSDDMREILGQVPRWIIRYGTLLIFAVFLVFVFVASYLKYPDIIYARIKLTTEIPPAELTANISGKIEKLTVKDNDSVQKGQVLMILQSGAEYKDVFLLKSILGSSYLLDSLVLKNFDKQLALGEIQDLYANLQRKLQDYESYQKLNYHYRKINSLKTELMKYGTYLKKLSEQEDVLKREYILTEKQYQRDSGLFVEQVLSPSQLEKTEAEKLKKLFEWKQTQTNLATAQIEMSNLQQEILEMEMNLEESNKNHEQGIQEAYEKIKGQLSLWEKEYLIISPFKGQLSMTTFWSENQRVEEGDIVMTVIPYDRGNIIGKIQLSAKGIGKIVQGQKVIIRFDNYPHMEYGTLRGYISSISLVPNNDLYTAEVKLDSNHLITNYNIELDFQQNMPGTADVITEEKSLLRRIVNPLKSVIRKQNNYHN
jgi:multidrug resistance efflux pump